MTKYPSEGLFDDWVGLGRLGDDGNRFRDDMRVDEQALSEAHRGLEEGNIGLWAVGDGGGSEAPAPSAMRSNHEERVIVGQWRRAVLECLDSRDDPPVHRDICEDDGKMTSTPPPAQHLSGVSGTT